jgi:hypothetical protein
MSMEDLLYEKKVPTTKHNYVGVELEFLIPRGNNDKLKSLLLKENLQWNVHLGTDGSVIDPNFVEQIEFRPTPWNPRDMMRIVTNEILRPLGKEIRILATEKEMPDYINKVCDILKKCKAYTNNTCGFHVHLDMRNRNVDKVCNNFYSLQNILFKMQPKHRRKNKYCMNLTREVMRRINSDIKKYDWDDDDRYYSINKLAYPKQRTLEIRLHEGTINPIDIRRWVYFLIKIATSSKKLNKRIDNIDVMEFSDNIKEYVNARIKQFAG